MKILITPTSLSSGKNNKAMERLEEFSSDLVFNPYGRPLTEEELISLLKDCDGYVAGLDYITENVLSHCNNLKVISRYGAGVDRVDVEAATKKGIRVTNTPGVNSVAVAELAMGLILGLARKIPLLNQSTKQGQWPRSTGMELANKTIGILGLGAIGKNLARYAQGFSMKVIAYDPYINEEYAKENNITVATFEQVIEASDVISLHLPLNKDTKHLINKEVIGKMKKGALLVNTSRGGLIDEEAAYEALKAGNLGGLGLDAFEVEPPTDSPLFELDHVIVTPHTGAHTKEATEKMAELSIENLINVLSNEECKYLIN